MRKTLGIGRALARVVAAGDLIALHGDLGAGKTHLVKGLVEGLGGATADEVVSPTFVLMVPYEHGRLPVHHVDAYRLSRAEELIDLGAPEVFADGVAVIEWAERVRDALPADRLEIEILHGETERHRRLILTAEGERGADLLDALTRELRKRDGTTTT